MSFSIFVTRMTLGFKSKKSIPRLTRGFTGALKDLGLEVKSERIGRREKRRSSEMRVLGMICSITPNGEIASRAPFQKLAKQLLLTRIEKKMEEAEAPKTLAFFFQLFLLMVKPYLFFFLWMRLCANRQRNPRLFSESYSPQGLRVY